MERRLKYKLFSLIAEILFICVLQERILSSDCAESSHCHNYLSNCFLDISKSLQCHISSSSSGEDCTLRNAKDLCLSLEDAINCTTSIIDWNCGLERGTYSAWMRGLQGILKKICYEDISMIKNLIENPKCWNPGTFLSCTEFDVGFSHITDLLSTPLDAAECNLVMVSIALCNAKAEKNRYKCRGTAKAVMVALTSFFAESSCMNTITHEVRDRTRWDCYRMYERKTVMMAFREVKRTIYHKLLEEHCRSQANLKAGISVSLTLVILLSLIAIIAVILTRSRIVTVSRRFRLYNDDDDKETFVE